MAMSSRLLPLLIGCVTMASICAGHVPAQAASLLTGFALLDANTFADGPTSGQFITPNNGVTPPFIAKQPVQGFSAVLPGPVLGPFLIKTDTTGKVLRSEIALPNLRGIGTNPLVQSP